MAKRKTATRKTTKERNVPTKRAETKPKSRPLNGRYREYLDGLEAAWETARAAHPNQLVPGGYYRTLVSGAIAAFGWDMLLTAAGGCTSLLIFESVHRSPAFAFPCIADAGKFLAWVVGKVEDFV